MDATATMIETQPSVEQVDQADAERLWRALFAFSGDADIASEAVNEAFAQMISRGSAVRDRGAWVWRTAFRITRGSLQARRTRDDRWAAEGSPGMDTHHQPDRHADQDLLAALAKLPEAQRAAVILYYYADLPVNQIADRLSSNSLAVRANLSRGRSRLRALLSETHE